MESKVLFLFQGSCRPGRGTFLWFRHTYHLAGSSFMSPRSVTHYCPRGVASRAGEGQGVLKAMIVMHSVVVVSVGPALVADWGCGGGGCGVGR